MKNSTWSTKSIPIDFEIGENGCFNCISHKPGKRGYPRTYRGVIYKHVFEQMYGKVKDGLVIRHTCDNKMCINPEHMILGTQSDNYRDAVERHRFPIGSKRPNAILDEEKAAEIKRLLKESSLTQKEIGKMFGVDRGTIKNIKRGQTWKHVDVS
jgi:DNA-binding XRE family transcriptional regulator